MPSTPLYVSRPRAAFSHGVCLTLALSLTVSVAVLPRNAFALSELKAGPSAQATDTQAQNKQTPGTPAPDTQVPGAPQAAEPEAVEGDQDGIPMPDPLINRDAGDQTAAGADSDQGDTTAEIEHDISKAPEPVKRLRQLIIDAARSGDIEKLRPLINSGPNQTRIDGDGDDPIATLKSFSGDPDGLEVLAIILDLLSTGYAHMDAGKPDEMYVFPYFAGKPLTTLTAAEKVELLRIITAGDLADMQNYGNYSFYRLGISPDGQWKFFGAGD